MRGIFWNSRGLRDLAKTKFLSNTTREQGLISLLSWKPVKRISHKLSLIGTVGGGILCGTGLNHMEGQEVCY